jgi:site-specific DNA-methyltransferase (adenine-specific)
MAGNVLYYGDNLHVLRKWIDDESVDLIYLDPPFNSKKVYNQIYKDSKAQERVFKDYWDWDDAADEAYRKLVSVESPAQKPTIEMLQAFRRALGTDDPMPYLVMMTQRLIELRRVMKPSGSLYLHCDPTASHYLKIILDTLFTSECFRNEVIWRYRRWPTKSRRFQRMHDVLLFYTANKGNEHTFNTLYGYEKLAASTLKTFGTKKQLADFSSGHRKPSVENKESQGPPLTDYWEIDDLEREDGLPLSDSWEVSVIAPIGKERRLMLNGKVVHFKTQKPLKLLERVIRASSDKGQLVLDPFCGCGTAVLAAEMDGRRWIGIDIGPQAVDIIRNRFAEIGVEPRVEGLPVDFAGARKLADEDKLGFQRWMVYKAQGRQVETRQRGPGDKGVDGEIIFQDGSRTRRCVLSVKGGSTNPSDVRDLIGTVSNENAFMGVLLLMNEPSKSMRDAAREAGHVLSSSGQECRKIQILTAQQLLDGERLELPGRNVTPSDRPGIRKGQTALPFEEESKRRKRS